MSDLSELATTIRDLGDASDELQSLMTADEVAISAVLRGQNVAQDLRRVLADARRAIDRLLIESFGHERDELLTLSARAAEVDGDLADLSTAIEPIINPTGYGSRVRHSDDRPMALKRVPGAHGVYR